MKYAEIHGLQIVTIHDELPSSWRNISGLCNLPDDEIADLGWSGNGDVGFYPIVEDPQPPFDPKTEKLTSVYEVDADNRVVNRSWSIVSFSQEEIDREWARLRNRRDGYLSACDYTQLGDAALGVVEKAAWSDYRQQLRDLPQNTTNPFDVTWPTPPDP